MLGFPVVDPQLVERYDGREPTLPIVIKRFHIQSKSRTVDRFGHLKVAGKQKRRENMCLSCGCGEPDDNHGDPRHITLAMLQEAAAAAEITTDDAAHNIVEATHAHGSH